MTTPSHKSEHDPGAALSTKARGTLRFVVSRPIVLLSSMAFIILLLGGVSASARTSSSGIWHPAPGTSWQWQLSGNRINTSFNVDAYDIDGFESNARTVRALHAKGSKAVCYVDVGSWESWRPDANKFPKRVIGDKYGGWKGERWLDIRRIKALAPIMRARLDMCKRKGFDAVEPDNIEGYTNKTGFRLTYKDQLRYNKWLAREAHARSLSIGLKNDPDQVRALLPYYDWALTEDCFKQGWCPQMRPFVRQGKAVLVAEYTDTGMTRRKFCARADRLKFDAILKKRDLGVWRRGC